MTGIRLGFLILVVLSIAGCSSKEDPMTDAEKYMADKYNAPWANIVIQETETKTDGKVTENRKYIAVQVKNSMDINRILEEGDYAEKRMKGFAQFVLDSVDIGEIPFMPNEIQITYIKEEGFSIFKNETKRTMAINLD